MIYDMGEEIFIKQTNKKNKFPWGKQSNKEDKIYGQSIKIQIKEKKPKRGQNNSTENKTWFLCTYISTHDPIVRGPPDSEVTGQREGVAVEGVRLPALDRAAHCVHSGVDRGVGATDLECHHDAAWKQRKYPQWINTSSKSHLSC